MEESKPRSGNGEKRGLDATGGDSREEGFGNTLDGGGTVPVHPNPPQCAVQSLKERRDLGISSWFHWEDRGQGFGHGSHRRRMDFSNGSSLLKHWLRVQGAQRTWLEDIKEGQGRKRRNRRD